VEEEEEEKEREGRGKKACIFEVIKNTIQFGIGVRLFSSYQERGIIFS